MRSASQMDEIDSFVGPGRRGQALPLRQVLDLIERYALHLTEEER
jgi:hypothetical protein